MIGEVMRNPMLVPSHRSRRVLPKASAMEKFRFIARTPTEKRKPGGA